MAAKNVVIVESPAKAKTINKYLGQDYTVLASYGHVRDLPAEDGSVDPSNDFTMRWEVDARSKKRIDEIASACKSASHVFLATDPDREGEAISWHMTEELEKRKAVQHAEVERVVFHEITKKAVLDAIAHPRDLNRELIEAYLARRALDYLVGFTLSPVLWRKLPGARSAGRVQSVALRLVCEREAEIEAFRTDEYWSVTADLLTPAGEPFQARLTHLNGKKLGKLDISSKDAADSAIAAVRGKSCTIGAVERKTVSRNPSPPFTTSTLQQEASRKLRLGASRTMQIAQKLYEGIDIGGETVGLITYMRTDSTNLSQEAIAAARDLITDDYGAAYLPDKPRIYKTKAKNAQEAHEAIRPTSLTRRPDQVRQYLDQEQLRLYELIWKRTVASQMASARLDQVSVDIDTDDRAATLRANGSVVAFDGFYTLYTEDRDDPADDEESNRRLPRMTEGDKPELTDVKGEQHFTQPPPRYTEASLVKKMEELGIGRPSTYASILKVLQDRDYVRLDQRRFIPEDRGRLVTSFLSSYFERYFEYGFTADLEESLDDVSGGRIDWKTVLRDFWDPFHKLAEESLNLSPQEVRETIDRDLGRHFFPVDENGDPEAARKCPACGTGRLGIRFGKNGAFIGCSNYPECRYTRQLDEQVASISGDGELELPKNLGTDPESGQDVSLRKGPYGFYVQLGEAEKGAKVKPKRASLLKSMSPSEIDLETALKLLALPRELGTHPDSGETVSVGIGRFGPYVKHGAAFITLPAGEDILSIGMNRAVEIIANAPQAKKRGGTPASEIGSHPSDGKPVSKGSGRFGPYVKHGKIFASIPKSIDPDEITLEQAVELIAQKASKSGNAKPATAKKSTAKKSKAKKSAAKKSAAKKKAAD